MEPRFCVVISDRDTAKVIRRRFYTRDAARLWLDGWRTRAMKRRAAQIRHRQLVQQPTMRKWRCEILKNDEVLETVEEV